MRNDVREAREKMGLPPVVDTASQPDEATPTTPLSTRRKWVWFFAGATYGLLIRSAFGLAAPYFSGAMSVAFLVGTPLAVGAIAVYGSPQARSSLWSSLAIPAIPMTLMLFGCAVTLLEGSICIAMMAPLFYILASLGGLFMGLAFKLLPAAKPTLGVFAALPVLLIPVDRVEPTNTFHELRETVVINAPARVVWDNLLHAKNIREEELPLSMTHLIGVPKPVNAENRLTNSGEIRFSEWERGVHFSATVVDSKMHESITWRYSFSADSFPPGTMDDHVVLGGRYLDLGDTTFNIRPISENSTQLEVVGRYRLTTPVNLYAVPISRLLGHDFLRTLLGFYKGRSERAVGVQRHV